MPPAPPPRTHRHTSTPLRRDSTGGTGSSHWPSRASSLRKLEHELGGQLNESRRRRGFDLPERGAGDVPVHGAGAVELRMIQDVERLETQLQGMRPAEPDLLDHREIEIL